MRSAADTDANIKSLQSRIASKTSEIGDMNKEASEVDEDIQAMIARFKELPEGQKEYAELLRARDLKQTQLDEAEIKAKAVAEGGQAARQQDQQPSGHAIEQLGAASLPQDPISPNRALIAGGGSLFGLLFGLVLAGTREIKSLDTNVTDTGLVEQQRSRWLSWTLAIAAGMAAMGWAVAHYYLEK